MSSEAAKPTLLRTVALAAIGLAASGPAIAGDAPLAPAEQIPSAATIELIDSSRLGCGQNLPMWTASNGGGQCAFDTATRGARITARHDLGSGWFEAYATLAHSTAGAFTPDRLLQSPRFRSNEATDLLLVGVKASALDGRLKLAGELARTDSVVDELVSRDWALADTTERSGTSALVRLDAILADRPGLKWSLAGEYRSVGDDYAIGRSSDLLRHYALPGSRLAL